MPERRQARNAAKSVGGYVYAGRAAQTKAAAAAGAKAAGSKVAAPTAKTIAVIELSATSSESVGVVAAVNQIAKLFDYKVITCDPNFDPQKVIQCATSMVAQHPSVIFSVSTNTGAMGSGFSQAVAAGIPWFDVVSAAVPAKGLYNYGTDGFKLTKILDDYMFKQMKAANAGKTPKLFGIDAPTVGIASANESKQVKNDAKAAGIDLTLHNLDLSNAVQDAIKSSQQALQQRPGPGRDVDLLRLLPAADGAAGADRQAARRSSPASTRTRPPSPASRRARSTPSPTCPGRHRCGSRWTRCCRTGRRRRRSRKARPSTRVPARLLRAVPDHEEQRRLRHRDPGLRTRLPDVLHGEVEQGVRHQVAR